MTATLPDWRGRAVVCIASGPSLHMDDCAAVRAAGLPTVVVNTTFRACPWADALFAFDRKWWRLHLPEVRATFRGRLFSTSLSRMPDVMCTRIAAEWRRWPNSGACAVALAMAAGAPRVVMLGFDCQRTGGQWHHHGDHPEPLGNCETIARWPWHFERLAAYAQKHGVAVINASRVSALHCFPRATLAQALELETA